MIDCLIIAEDRTIEMLSGFFRGLPFTLTGTANTYEGGLSLINPHKRYLVYIDAEVVMKRYGELQLMKDMHCFIILYNEIDSANVFEGLGVGYLSAPITFDAFKSSLLQFGQYLLAPLDVQKPLPLVAGDDCFIVKEGTKNLSDFKIRHSDLLYIESNGNYINVYHINGRLIVIRSTMKAAIGMLPGNSFSRVSKAHILNDNMVDSIRWDFVFLNDKKRTVIPIGEAYRAAFLEKEKIQMIRKNSRGSGIINF